MLIQFGFRKSFSVQNKGSYSIIRLRNKEVLLLTGEDIRRINHKNAISFNERILKSKRYKYVKRFVELCFAILVRSMQLKGYLGQEYSESKAIKVLTRKGIETTHFHELLGVKRTQSKPVTLKRLLLLKKRKSVLLFNERHITICSEGWYEDFGKARPLENEIPVLLSRKAKYWYSIK